MAEDAHIGLSWVFPVALTMKSGSKIGHFNTIIHLEKLSLGEKATISRGNWITGFPKSGQQHFSHRKDRDPSLVIGDHSAITKNHHIDCTDRIEIGKFSTVAGYGSQLLTHSIDIHENRQDCQPIVIGDYCFVGTDVVILGGGRLPGYSVLGAKALLQKEFSEEWFIYAGVPAKQIAPIPKDARYFLRENGFVY